VLLGRIREEEKSSSSVLENQNHQTKTMNLSRKQISLACGMTAAASAVFLEAAYTPGYGTVQWIALACSMASLAVLRLYLFSEGSALAEISKLAAKIAFKISVAISVLMILYGVGLFAINPLFDWHELFLFVVLQFALSGAEWVLAQRTGYTKNYRLVSLVNRSERLLEIGKKWRERYGQLAQRVADLEGRINTLTTENSNQSSRLAVLESKAGAKVPEIKKVAGYPVGLCPLCWENGKINILTGSPRSNNLRCEDHGAVLTVKNRANN
jgi:hypothetical protein